VWEQEIVSEICCHVIVNSYELEEF